MIPTPLAVQLATLTESSFEDASSDANLALVLAAIAFAFILVGFFLILVLRYKRCPSDKILVVYGKTGSDESAKSIHGGAKFVFPLIQSYAYLSLEPMRIKVDLERALTQENIRIAVPSVFTVAIGTTPSAMANAADRLLSLTPAQITEQAQEIIHGQLRQVISSMTLEEIYADREACRLRVQASLERALAKIGLVLINANIKDITDEHGYLEAFGQKAAAKAISQAKSDTARLERSGTTQALTNE